MIEHIVHNGCLFAIIIASGFRQKGIAFFTPPDFSQQLGYMNRPKGYRIDPHVHEPVERTVTRTQEVLVVRSGTVKVNFYDDDKKFVKDTVISAGDVILLATGGHGFEFLEDAELIEVKQGPYAEGDKISFEPSTG